MKNSCTKTRRSRNPVRLYNGTPPGGASRQDGFTIIELMITVTVAAVLAAIAFPSFDYALANSRVRTATSDLHMSLLFSRSEAIKRNNNVTMEKNTDWVNGWDVKSGGTVIRTWDALGDVTVECYTDPAASTACGSAITFERSGRADSYVEYRLYNSSDNNIPARCVRVSLSGRAGVTVDSDADPTDGCD